MSSTFKNMVLLISAIVALGGGYWLSQSARSPGSTPTTKLTYGGGAFIDFSLHDVDGGTRSLKDWRGKVIVLNFWATWCSPCREEIPLFIDLQKKHAADNLQIIGIAIDDRTAVLAYRQSMGMNYPTLLGDDYSMQLMADYGNRTGSLPYTVIIDHNGVIVVRKLGAFSRTEIEGLIDPLLKPKQPSAPQTT